MFCIYFSAVVIVAVVAVIVVIAIPVHPVVVFLDLILHLQDSYQTAHLMKKFLQNPENHLEKMLQR